MCCVTSRLQVQNTPVLLTYLLLDSRCFVLSLVLSGFSFFPSSLCLELSPASPALRIFLHIPSLSVPFSFCLFSLSSSSPKPSLSSVLSLFFLMRSVSHRMEPNTAYQRS